MLFSSDDEYNEKENISPDLQEDGDDSTAPKGDPVKAFIDEEAEEEDSDNDINCLRDDDEDVDMDAEELNDIIATNYEERPADKERRNELHQKWLEQQDAAGTDHFLKKFKFSSKGRETTIADEGHTDSEDEEETDNEVQDAVCRDTARMNLKKAKQMIAQMFIDKDDVFLSDEEEETGKILEKQRLLRSEERARLISPAEDENSREVFGLIKKLNIVPEHKRKPKPACMMNYFASVIYYQYCMVALGLLLAQLFDFSAILDTMLGESSDSSFKSSFIGRSSDHHLPSSKGQRSSVTRSFVFGRDDSNSRSSLLTAEDSSAAVPKDIKSSKNTTAKFTSSQVRSSQVYSSAGGNSVETSLLDILKKSSTLPSVKSTGISMSGLSGSVLDAYKIPRRPVRAEARGL
ncbi:DNA metabolism protein [Lithospermum erythrorhizon]|uniref:DNA metabolism protein n=1 Tax=Lithospermum erythrorhizon TaxID=34254 RepID=A0AAV3NJU0_LITER